MYSKKKPNTLVLQSLQFKQSNCQFPSNLHLNAQYNSHAKLSISSVGLTQRVHVGGRGRLRLNLWIATGLGELCCPAELSDLFFWFPSNKWGH